MCKYAQVQNSVLNKYVLSTFQKDFTSLFSIYDPFSSTLAFIQSFLDVQGLGILLLDCNSRNLQTSMETTGAVFWEVIISKSMFSNPMEAALGVLFTETWDKSFK